MKKALIVTTNNAQYVCIPEIVFINNFCRIAFFAKESGEASNEATGTVSNKILDCKDIVSIVGSDINIHN